MYIKTNCSLMFWRCPDLVREHDAGFEGRGFESRKRLALLQITQRYAVIERDKSKL